MEYNENEMVTVSLERWETTKEFEEKGKVLEASLEWTPLNKGTITVDLDSLSSLISKVIGFPVVQFKSKPTLSETEELEHLRARVKLLEGKLNEIREIANDDSTHKLAINFYLINEILSGGN